MTLEWTGTHLIHLALRQFANILCRYVHFASRLTGWNAIKSRVEQLNLTLTDAQIKVVTQKIKALADVRPIAIDDADSIIRTFHLNLTAAPEDEKPLIPNMSAAEKKAFAKAEMELAGVKEKRALDEEAEADAPAKKTRTKA
jgi:homocitrate synthase